MVRILVAALSLAAAAGAVEARAQTPNDIALSASEACAAVPDGGLISAAATRLGFQPAGPNRYVRTLTPRALEISVKRTLRRGNTVGECTVVVWGPLDTPTQVIDAFATRTRAKGYVPTSPQTTTDGPFELKTLRGTGMDMRMWSLWIADSPRPANGASFILNYLWLE